MYIERRGYQAMGRKILFIKVEDEYWLSRPSSMFGGWARSLWFKRNMGVQKVSIASYDYWQELKNEHGILVCSEEDGEIIVKPLVETA